MSANKREFVAKMLPVIDALREVPRLAPATSEREQNMHKNFGSLTAQVLSAFEKFGYKEYVAGIF